MVCLLKILESNKLRKLFENTATAIKLLQCNRIKYGYTTIELGEGALRLWLVWPWLWSRKPGGFIFSVVTRKAGDSIGYLLHIVAFFFVEFKKLLIYLHRHPHHIAGNQLMTVCITCKIPVFLLHPLF